MIILSDGQDSQAIVDGRSVTDILAEATRAKIPVYLIRMSYNKGFGRVLPDEIWKPAIEATGGKFYAAADESTVLRAITEIDRRSAGTISTKRYSTGQPQFSPFALVAAMLLGGRARVEADHSVFSEVSLMETRAMKSIITPTILALVLLAAGSVCWTLGQAEDRVARVTTQVMTMGYKAVAEDAEPLDVPLTYAARVPLVGDDLGSAMRDDRASANYWLGRYEALTLQRDSGGALVEHDPQLLLFAANAAYRANQLEPADRQTSIQRLQTIVTYYADLLKSHPDVFDAAYNYEFTARLRSTLEQRSPRAPARRTRKRPRGRQEGAEHPWTARRSGERRRAEQVEHHRAQVRR